ncbi:MAG: hypothetical protein IPN95_21800 [Bacteroidetes bacterium]|nr:hypothetical protein [Bacteroidota bacterium]
MLFVARNDHQTQLRRTYEQGSGANYIPVINDEAGNIFQWTRQSALFLEINLKLIVFQAQTGGIAKVQDVFERSFIVW